MSLLKPTRTVDRRGRGWFGRRGVAASEFAVVVPVFFLIVLATADIIRVFRAQIRMEMIAVQIGQIVSQCSPKKQPNDSFITITNPGDINEFWGHAARIAGGLVDVNSPTGGSMILTAVSFNSGTNANRLDWQVRTGNTSATSVLNAAVPGDRPTLVGTNGATFLAPPGQTLFVFEANAVVIPWTLSAGLIGTVLPREISAVTMFLTRISDPARAQAPPTNSAARSCTA